MVEEEGVPSGRSRVEELNVRVRRPSNPKAGAGRQVHRRLASNRVAHGLQIKRNACVRSLLLERAQMNRIHSSWPYLEPRLAGGGDGPPRRLQDDAAAAARLLARQVEHLVLMSVC